MRFLTRFAMAVLVASSLATVGVVRADSQPPQMQLKTYALPNNPESADISPDEQLVVTLGRVHQGGGDPKIKSAVVQLWNFKEGQLLAEFSPRDEAAKAFAKRSLPNPIHGDRIVRFSPDGSTIAALIDQTIHILRAIDLTEIRTVPLVNPGTVTKTAHGRTTVTAPEVRAMEISPSGEAVAVLWVIEYSYGRIQLYNLLSGRNTVSWNTPQGWVDFTRGLVWHPDGRSLLLAIPNNTPCLSPNRDPDVFAFDARTGVIQHQFTTGLLTGSIAITSDNRVLAVDLDCRGVFKDLDPKLKVFNLDTGKRLRDVSGRTTGVRYLVSASADGSRFLAFTGTVKAKFDWGDWDSYDVTVDETFSVWSLTNYEGIVTSQNIPGLMGSGLRLSSKGRYAVSYGKASFVYELP